MDATAHLSLEKAPWHLGVFARWHYLVLAVDHMLCSSRIVLCVRRSCSLWFQPSCGLLPKTVDHPSYIGRSASGPEGGPLIDLENPKPQWMMSAPTWHNIAYLDSTIPSPCVQPHAEVEFVPRDLCNMIMLSRRRAETSQLFLRRFSMVVLVAPQYLC